MSGHTPGPWHVYHGTVHSDVGGPGGCRPLRYPIADCRVDGPAKECGEIDGNTCLIAAAPTLLAALKDMVAWHLERDPGCISNLGITGARLAIAKAEDKA